MPNTPAAYLHGMRNDREDASGRWVLEPEDVLLLERVFEREKCPGRELRAQLASRLRVKPRQIQVWFQNKRQRTKSGAKPTVAEALAHASAAKDDPAVVADSADAEMPMLDGVEAQDDDDGIAVGAADATGEGAALVEVELPASANVPTPEATEGHVGPAVVQESAAPAIRLANMDSIPTAPPPSTYAAVVDEPTVPGTCGAIPESLIATARTAVSASPAAGTPSS